MCSIFCALLRLKTPIFAARLPFLLKYTFSIISQ
jgi:hypothetical protein